MTPPNDADLERAVIGSALSNADAFDQARTVIGPDDFYAPAHRLVWEVMADPARPCGDVVSLVEALRARRRLEDCGGVAAVARLSDWADPSLVRKHAERLRELATVRKVMDAARLIQADGARNHVDAAAFAEAARRRVTDAAGHLDALQQGPEALAAVLPGVLSDLESQGPIPGVVQTGLSLDALTGGLWPGLLSIFAGRPGMGKTALALAIARYNARRGKRVLYLPLEDEQRLCVLRLIADSSEVELFRLITRSLHDDDYGRIMRAAESLHHLPLWIDDRSGRTAAQIAQTAALHQRRHGLDLLIVDHIGEVADRDENRTVEVERIARALRDCAKELRIPVVAMAQLNRGNEDRRNKRPVLADLRQSGAIEQVARLVVFLYRPGYYSKDAADKRLELIVAKNTHGRTGVAYERADLDYMHIRDWDEPQDGVFETDHKRAAGMDPVEVPRGDIFG